MLLARDSPVAIVLRRARSRSIRVFLWDRSDDSFRPGGSFRCRLYERRCDLAPDGRHWVFFAYDGHGVGGYTGVARAPSAKPLHRWDEGLTWCGGGLFTAPGRVWLSSGGEAPDAMRRPSPPGADPIEVESRDSAEGMVLEGLDAWGDARVYPRRLLRDGWHLTVPPPTWRNDYEAVLDKPVHATLTLRKRSYGSGRPRSAGGECLESHEILRGAAMTVDPHEDWEWADWDGQRLLWAAAGGLFAARPREDGLEDVRCLHDFTG